MELSEFNNANSNQTTVIGNGTSFNINQQQMLSSQQSQAQQLQPNNQMTQAQQHMYRNHHHQQQQQAHPALRYANNIKVSKHRELPVDVPDSFVGVKKQAPRYPPPKPNRQVSPSVPNNYLTTFNNAPSTMPYNNTTSATSTTAQQQQQPGLHSPISQNTAANIVTHNSSLRSSIKLKQLEKSRNGQHGNYPVGHMQPAVNQAFELNEDETAVTTINNGTSTNQNVANSAKHALKMKQTMPDLCSIYNRLQRNLNEEFVDASGDAKLAKLLSIYNTIVQTHNKQFRIPTLTSRHNTIINAQGNQEPLTYKVTDLLQSVIFLLHNDEGLTAEAAELLSILCKHEVDGVCSAFDRIAQSFEFAKSSRSNSPQESMELVHEDVGALQPVSQPPMYQHKPIAMHQLQPHQMDDYNNYASDQVTMDIENNLYQNSLLPLADVDLSDSTSTKTVSIEKTSNQALGATIRNEVDGSVVIGRIVCGGAAHRSGLLHEGDEILEVNGVQMRGKNVNEVVNILERMNGTLTFTVISRNYNKPIQMNQQEIFVRTFFKYDAEDDEFLPCKELGLSFEKGEILAIIDQSDPRWWQARRESDSEWRLAGLIPSINFLKEREKDANHEDIAISYSKQGEKKNLVSLLFNCPKGTSSKRRKKPPNITCGPDEIPYYEEVCIHYPDNYRKRPILLVGPKMIGQSEILTKLLLDTTRFASAISHTSKPMQQHERNGVNFHFVSRAQFEADIEAGKFLEYGSYQNQFYGTTIEAVKEVVRSKKVSYLRSGIYPKLLKYSLSNLI